ncbi:YceI family protein [Haloferula sp. A504]|uniref:YceI family protein n=1 Tax=Haloferula sp. A504 TaxID=3373601 RepID=UPI0031C0E5BD|nr:YceI family protein [Verrucomicrobiaceae bacterium E54]
MKATPLILPCLFAAALVSCENPADQTADATTTEAVETTGAAAEGTAYVITDSSTITFVGSKVTGSHDGGFKEFDGTFTVNDAGEVTGGEFVIDMNSTWSDADKLTEHLKAEDFFHVAEHPQSKFTVTGVEKTDDGYSISGNLMLRGVEKNITFPATASKDGDTVKVTAEFDINRKDWGIIYAGKADDLIRNEVVIKFDLTATPEA